MKEDNATTPIWEQNCLQQHFPDLERSCDTPMHCKHSMRFRKWLVMTSLSRWHHCQLCTGFLVRWNTTKYGKRLRKGKSTFWSVQKLSAGVPFVVLCPSLWLSLGIAPNTLGASAPCSLLCPPWPNRKVWYVSNYLWTKKTKGSKPVWPCPTEDSQPPLLCSQFNFALTELYVKTSNS